MLRICLYFSVIFILFSCAKKIIVPKIKLTTFLLKAKKPSKKIDLLPITDSSIAFYIGKYPSKIKYAFTLLEFYKKRNYDYVWLNKDGLLPRIDLFYNMMNSIQPNPEFSIDSLGAIYSQIVEDTSFRMPSDSLRQLETRLSIAFFEFAEREWSGSDEKLIRKLEWYIPKKKLHYDEILDSILKIDANELSLFRAPIYHQYYLLKACLERYKKIQISGGWQAIFTNKKTFRLGDTSILVTLIKKRLYVTGDLALSDSLPAFDSTLFFAVKAFQKRFGMFPDGKVSILVMKEMNRSIAQRIEQIIVNMERARWIPFDIDSPYLAVNIPEYKLYAFDGLQKLWEMKVVVGKATHKTIIFTGNIQYIVLNPYWVVTSNIFTKEFLPKLRKNPNYLKKENIELVKATNANVHIDPNLINWNQNKANYHIMVARQRPGSNNSLGKVKFIFPNQYSIYLHDTPAKTLFASENRSFSHGCIRVEKPEFLTKYLLKDNPIWTENALQKAWSTNTEQYIPLKYKMPVFITYFTAWVDVDGKLNFRNDIYGHDAKMAKLIFDKPMQ